MLISLFSKNQVKCLTNQIKCCIFALLYNHKTTKVFNKNKKGNDVKKLLRKFREGNAP